MSYELLLNELETLQKSYAAGDKDDQAIAAAADEARADDEDELDADGKPVAKKKKRQMEPDGDEGQPFGKSFTLVGEDGIETEAIDGTELVKSMHDELTALGKTVEAEKADLSKSLDILTDVIKSQGALIKSLQSDFSKLANQGTGRKSIVAPNATMAKSMDLTPQTFMAKAHAAYAAKRISGKDLTVCDVSLRHNEPIDGELLSRIFPD